jgi:predicted metal-dependent hydrolase
VISEHPDLPLPVAVTRMRRARRLRLRVDHRAKLLRLTIPWRASAPTAIAWAAGQRAWVERQLQKAPPPRPFRDGVTIPFEGGELHIAHRPGERRGVRLSGNLLEVGGPEGSLATSVERFLRQAARDRLSEQTALVAKKAGVSVSSVSIGDPESRWGSCSCSGAIRYNWRLILAPPELLRFVVAHEVAHRLHMDHSAAFKAAEERLFGGPVDAARSELRRLGPAMRAVGRH